MNLLTIKNTSLNKKERFEIRLTAIEKRVIENRANKAGIKPSEFVRNSVLEKVIKTKLSEEELEILKNLFEVGNELRSFKSKEPSKKNEEIDKIIEDLKNIINMFYDR